QSSRRTRRSNAYRTPSSRGKPTSSTWTCAPTSTLCDTISYWRRARRGRDDAVLWLLRVILKASGRQGVPQGGVISPLLSNVYLTEVDRMLERAKEVHRHERWG